MINQTWRELHKENFNIIRQTFRKLNLSLAVNKWEDKELWIKDILNVEVENWKLSTNQSKTEMKALNDPVEMNETDSVEMNETDPVDMNEADSVEMNEANEIEMMKKEYVLKKENQDISIDESERDSDNELENEKRQK